MIDKTYHEKIEDYITYQKEIDGELDIPFSPMPRKMHLVFGHHQHIPRKCKTCLT